MPILALGVVIAILYFGRLFFITSLIALTIAFILEPFVALLMRIRFPRCLASFVVCSFALALLYVIGLGRLLAARRAFTTSCRSTAQRIGDIVDGDPAEDHGAWKTRRTRWWCRRGSGRKRSAGRQQEQAQAAAKKGKQGRRRRAAAGAAGAGRDPRSPDSRREHAHRRLHLLAPRAPFYQVLLMVSFIPFLVYFMLSWRDHINRSFLQFFHGEDRLVAARSVQGIADMVRAFVVGNFVLGLLLALLSSIAVLADARAVSACWWVR